MGFIRCTSINRCPRANYQIDYAGLKENCLEGFERWCRNNGVVWSHLFDEETGQMIATYNPTQGLTTLV